VATGVAARVVIVGEAGSAQPKALTRMAASTPRAIGAAYHRRSRGRLWAMWVLLLEMLAALGLLLFIVWWTMFAGRRRGERRDDGPDAQ
jgi:hypothetical protein